MKKAKSYIWMKVSSDKFELPEAVADTAVELAKLCGVTANGIYSQISRVRSGALASCPYLCIAV